MMRESLRRDVTVARVHPVTSLPLYDSGNDNRTSANFARTADGTFVDTEGCNKEAEHFAVQARAVAETWVDNVDGDFTRADTSADLFDVEFGNSLKT